MYRGLAGGCCSRTVKQRGVNTGITNHHSFPTPGLQGEVSLPTQGLSVFFLKEESKEYLVWMT